MSDSTVNSAAFRFRPGGPGLTAGLPGSVIKFSFTNAASAAQALRAAPGGVGFIELKTTAACHIVFGDAAVGAPTNSEFLLEPTDGWQAFVVAAADTTFRVKGDSASGDLYVAWLGNY